jgi:hypothetical protein
MVCFECLQAGERREAAALCHHCSAALCREHAMALTDPVIAQYPIFQTVTLPLPARVILCETCWSALRQTAGSAGRPSAAGAGGSRSGAEVKL